MPAAGPHVNETSAYAVLAGDSLSTIRRTACRRGSRLVRASTEATALARLATRAPGQ